MFARGAGVKWLKITVQTTVRQRFMYKPMVMTPAHQQLPYTGWSGQLFVSMRQLEHMDLFLHTDAAGPHLAEGDLQALRVCTNMRHLNIDLDVALELSYTAPEAVTLLTQLTSLTLVMNYDCMVTRRPLPILKGIRALQRLQTLDLSNHQRMHRSSNSACNVALQGVSNLTHLRLQAIVSGFPDILAMKQLQLLKVIMWSAANEHGEVFEPSSLAGGAAPLTWLRCLEYDHIREEHCPAFTSVSKLVNLQTLMIQLPDMAWTTPSSWQPAMLQAMLCPLWHLSALQLCAMDIIELPECFTSLLSTGFLPCPWLATCVQTCRLDHTLHLCSG